MNNTDKVFQDNRINPGTFTFNDEVCSVFDDMVERSVPGYLEVQTLASDIFDLLSNTRKFLDVGCSTGNIIDKILSTHGSRAYGIGVDVSANMLEAAQKKLVQHENNLLLLEHNFIKSPLNHFSEQVNDIDFVILNLTLQFLRPTERFDFLKNIWDSISQSSSLLLVEKILLNDDSLATTFTDAYYRFKSRNGYTDEEISRKRLALENKLIPFTNHENIELVKSATGLNKHEIFYSNLVFRGYIFYK
ncbi:methyltransferase domain-containing protein [Pseudomonas protegens]|uniref:methyltransferase domain-containing protein n=1 Tax=Pseudomonas protegens TaxID=380021 RepID=UPI0037F31793